MVHEELIEGLTNEFTRGNRSLDPFLSALSHPFFFVLVINNEVLFLLDITGLDIIN